MVHLIADWLLRIFSASYIGDTGAKILAESLKDNTCLQVLFLTPESPISEAKEPYFCRKRTLFWTLKRLVNTHACRYSFCVSESYFRRQRALFLTGKSPISNARELYFWRKRALFLMPTSLINMENAKSRWVCEGQPYVWRKRAVFQKQKSPISDANESDFWWQRALSI
jgi:hypothetical protein